MNIVNEFIVLLPLGEKNAIGRKLLVEKSISAGLVPDSIKDKDRFVRNIYQDAKEVHAICHTNKGYFIPLPEDRDALSSCIAEDRKKALSILSGNRMRVKLKADFDAGRV